MQDQRKAIDDTNNMMHAIVGSINNLSSSLSQGFIMIAQALAPQNANPQPQHSTPRHLFDPYQQHQTQNHSNLNSTLMCLIVK